MLPLVVVLVAGGCADLAMDPDRVPSTLVISPADTALIVGDRVRFGVTVLDQNGDSLGPWPPWAAPEWATADARTAYISPDGLLDAVGQADTEVVASFAGLTTRTRLRVNPASLVLTAPHVYLTQSVQNRAGSVPLISGRRALLRVFVTGDQDSFYQPRVNALFFHDDRLVHGALMSIESDVLPGTVDEGRLELSYNAMIPGSVIQPGTTMLVELDRDGTVPLGPGSQLRVPAAGRLTLDVRRLPRMDLTVVPVVLASNQSNEVYEWAEGLTVDSEHLRLARSVLPIGDMTAEVHEGFVTSSDLSTGAGWGELLGDLTFLRIAEGERGYYYGAVVLSDDANWEGVGYFGYPVGVGAADHETLAHELGHNLDLRHAPCGGAGGPDPSYPYDGGIIGVYGYDFHRERVVDSFLYKDVMGYCSPAWVSDYSFTRALAFRHEAETDVLMSRPAAFSQAGATGRTMLLRGRIGGGEMVLEPSFMVELPPILPETGGPYRIDGLGPAGQHRFSMSFAPRPVEFGGGHFLFSLPFDPDVDGSLEQVVLSGPEGSYTLERSGARRTAIVTDGSTGRVRAILRNWKGNRAEAARLVRGNPEVAISNGLPVSEGLPH